MHSATFSVSAETGAVQRRRLHQRLASSLAHLAGALADDAAAHDLQTAAAAVPEHSRTPPNCFSAYFRLLRAFNLSRDDDVAASAIELGTRLKNRVEPRPVVRAFRAGEENEAFWLEVFEDFCSDSLHREQIGGYGAVRAEAVEDEVKTALDLLAEHAPISFAELSESCSEILPVRGVVRDGMTFDGCSSIERWGSILINSEQERSLLYRAETLVHETAHSLLFSMTCQEFRVLNDASERHTSPLRLDPRPLDGIYHAVFVLARMYFAMSEVAHSPSAPEVLRAEALSACERNARNFRDGYAVLAEHARYTTRGREVIAASRALVPECALAS